MGEQAEAKKIADSTTSFLSILLPVLGVYTGCITDTWLFELLVKIDPGCGDLLTASQFLFTAFFSFFLNLEKSPKSFLPYTLKERKYGLKYHILCVFLYFLVSVLINKAVEYDVNVPLHIIIRSGNILSSALIGWLVFRRGVTAKQVFWISILTCGICLFTYASSPSPPPSPSAPSPSCSPSLPSCSCDPTEIPLDHSESKSSMYIGVSLLCFSLILNALMGPIQDKMYQSAKTPGKYDGKEALFYSHALSIPLFSILIPSIVRSFWLIYDTEPFSLFGVDVPSGIIYWFFNLVTHYLCIYSVYALVAKTSSLTTAVILVTRKFSSIFFNVLYFKTEFSTLHWAGVMLAATGVMGYSVETKRKGVKRALEEEGGESKKVK